MRRERATYTRRSFVAYAAVCASMLCAATLAGCGADTGVQGGDQAQTDTWDNDDTGTQLALESSLALDFATRFSVRRYEGGYRLLCLGDKTRYLVVPNGADVPDGLASDIALIRQPVENVYLVASSVHCLFEALDAVGSVSALATEQKDCSVEGFSRALASGDVLYAGKYSAPDFEMLLDMGCTLAIENNMINHKPQVRDKLKSLGMTVLVDQSSTEPAALGRLEWIKLYGELLDKQELAQRVFDEQKALVEEASSPEPLGVTVAFFYINANGQAVTRKSGDYVAQMIAMAGGTYIFDDLGADVSTSTVTLETERFYEAAKDADVLIYNATIDDTVLSRGDLIAKCGLLREFKSVREDAVWRCDSNMYQQMTRTGAIVRDMHRVLIDPESGDLEYLHRLV